MMTAKGGIPKVTIDDEDFVLDLFDSAVEERRIRHAGSLAWTLNMFGWSWSRLGRRAGVSGMTVKAWMYKSYQFDKESRIR